MSNVIHAFPTDEELKIVAFIRKFGIYVEDAEQFVKEHSQVEGMDVELLEIFAKGWKPIQDRYMVRRNKEDEALLLKVCWTMGWIPQGQRYYKPLPFGLDNVEVIEID